MFVLIKNHVVLMQSRIILMFYWLDHPKTKWCLKLFMIMQV